MATSFPTYPATTFEQAVELAIFSSNQLHNIINADPLSTVETEDGDIPSVRKAIIDNLYFKTPAITWVEGTSVTVFNQLYKFSGGTTGTALWYAPTATTTNPITMGSSPEDDANWKIYGWDTYSKSELNSTSGAGYIGTSSGSNVESELDSHADSISSLDTNVSSLNSTVTNLESPSGFSLVGQVDSFNALRSLSPTAYGETVLLSSYATGVSGEKSYGGGVFYAVNANLTDDGGFVAKVSDSWSWVRRKDIEDATVLDFGGVPGATGDISASLLAMHTSLGFAKIPPGDFGISSISDSTITSLNILGSLDLYGRSQLTNLYITGTGSGVLLDFTVAQVTNIGRFNLFCNSYSGIFYDNTAKTGGKFYNLEKMVIHQSGNVVFNMTDTLDTLISEIYSYECAGTIAKGRWDNEVSDAWDHNTAIVIRDCNFNGSTGMQTLDLPRVQQARMDNVWFQNCEYPADLSQGQWDINTLCVENPTNPIYGEYAKLNITAPDYIGDNAFVDYTKSGYESSWDDGTLNNGNIPSWVTSGYENGHLNINNKTIQLYGELAVKAQTPLYRLPDTSPDEWVYVGTVILSTIGAVAEIVVLGSNQFNGASSTTTDPRTSGLGGGRTVIRMQHKGTTDGITTTWYNEGSAPVQDVKYVQPYNTDFAIYVKLSSYTYKTGMFIHTTDFNRFEQGATFQFTPYLSTVSDITAVSGIKDAPSVWTINNGATGAGIGMDLDSGRLIYQGALDSTTTKIPIMVNGNLKYIAFTDS